MIPSVLAQHVRKGVEDFLETTFPVSSPFFHGMLERLLAEEGGVFKGPYLSLQLPFLHGEGRADRFPDVPLPYPPYRHQERAFDRLGGPTPKSTIVATGTGSGKTECFLWPILDYCYQHRDQPGIKAILVYPMNALATDQASRIARAIWDNPKLKGQVTAGLYVGEGQSGTGGGAAAKTVEVMTRDDIITNRATLRLKPPSILLTNYKMLDYLLVRPRDLPLWKENGPETLRFLVVDELHTFDGAQGTDLACLIRRLKARLKIPSGHLCCVGTSATLGGEGKQEGLLSYAGAVFGERFDSDAVITEARESAGDFLGGSMISRIELVPPSQAHRLDPGRHDTYADYLRAQHELWFGVPVPAETFGESAWRLALGDQLKSHLFFQNVLRALEGQPRSFAELLRRLDKVTPGLRDAEPAYREHLLASLLALVSEARVRVRRKEGDEQIVPFLNVRVQLWLRELRRMVGQVSQPPRLRFADDLNELQLRTHLPVVHCRECGAMGWAGTKRQSETRIHSDLKSFYIAFFSRSPTVVFLFPEREDEASDGLEAVPGKLCPSCLRVTTKLDQQECASCGSGDLIFVQVPDSRVKRKERFVGIHDCPYCGNSDGLTIVGSRAPSLTSVLVAQLFSSTYNDDKKLLTFSDSVQDAAHRAGFFAARTFRFNLRAALQQFVLAEGDGLALADLPEKFSGHWIKHLGTDLAFVATFLAPDISWFRDYDLLTRTGDLPANSHLAEDVKRRIGWEIFCEYGFNCRIGRTLEKTGSSVLHADSRMLDGVIARLLEPLRNEVGPLRKLGEPGLRLFLLGLVTRLKNQGGIVHSALGPFIENLGNSFLISKGMPWMPRFGRFSRAPKFITTTAGKRFDAVLSPKAGNPTWYQKWAEKCFDHLGGSVTGETDRIYQLVLPALGAAGLLSEHEATKNIVWGLRPEALRVSTQVAHLRCRRCGHNLSVAEAEAASWVDGPCLRFHCSGRYERLAGSDDYYGKLYATGDVQRVFSKEHTGLLDRGAREELEQQFKAGRNERKPWFPNLLSCTPTLEMGIDIGDLSSLILCSVPPAQASYLQRIGRTGRRDGNSLNLTVANARPHDLYFFADPEEMISGRVEPPGVFLDASAVVERQLTAYCFDRWVETGLPQGAVPDTMDPVLRNLDGADPTRFPHNLLRFIDSHRTALLERFLADFGVAAASSMGKHLTTFMEGAAEVEGSLPYRILADLHRLEKQRKALAARVKLLTTRIGKKKEEKARDKNYDEELAELEREKDALQKLMTTMTGKPVFNFFTDEGLLPNYAFPEAGVILKSIIWRRREQAEDGGPKYDTWAYEYERPAAAAIAELAPANNFYAGGRKVEIDQVDMSLSDIETWRLCRSCSYSELVGEREPQVTCPRCGDTGWSDAGQKRQMLRMRQVYASTSDRDSRIGDDADDREPNFYDKQMLVDADPKDIRRAFKVDSDELPFGFEFLARATFREINFGEKGEHGAAVSVAGIQMPRSGFAVCRHCGKVQREDDESPRHAITCTARSPGSERNLMDCVYLYREFSSEAIRILLPVAKFGESDRSLHSFVAALHLGLKKRFGGNIDHLQMALQEEPVPESPLRKQYLVLYDTVPGGTGYLKQLMLSKDQLIAVFEGALRVLQTCSCTKDPAKDGCYRCLFAYRHSYDMKETSRQTAVELLSGVLEHQEKLVETKTLRDVSVRALFDSAFEARFVEALRRSAEPGRPVLLRTEVVAGRPGWFFEIGKRAYTIELHKNVGPNDCAPVPCEVDFLFRPIGSRGGGKPVAVFTDGFEFHKSRVGIDMAQRSGLIRSGRYHVWSLTWKDVESAFAEQKDLFRDYLDPGDLPGGSMHATFADHYGAADLKDARQQNSFQWLVRFLADPEPEACVRRWKSLAFVHGLTSIDAKGWSTPAARAGWDQDLRSLLPGVLADEIGPESEGTLRGLFEQHGQKGSRTVRVFASIVPDAVKNAAAVKTGDVGALRSLLYLRDTAEEVDRHGFDRIWAGYLRLANLMQFLPRAVFITQMGLDQGRMGGLPPLTLESWAPPAEPDPWALIREVVDPDRHGVLAELASVGWPLPVDPPYELVEAEETIAEAELAWPDLKIAVLDEQQLVGKSRFEQRGWRVLMMAEVLAAPRLLLDLHQPRGGR
ncbi:MAG: DEAD/DEAH box helicase [Acidobacteria bacterium]|nr:DEAD/DEAH box helicase [Acidobacteriota bacterium]